MPSNPALHIVAFDIPYPPCYGGVIDVFFKLRALSELGVRLHLHCFRYRDKPPAPQLERYCEAVHYYERPLHIGHQFSSLPFVVATRRPRALLERLAEQPYPILLEGLHTCGFIDHPALRDRWQAVRMHNIEWRYYRNLAGLEPHWAKRWYLHLESRKLKRFERRVLARADLLLPISAQEAAYFRERGPAPVQLLPAFHGNRSVSAAPGRGAYALFHGNLSVRDNERAAFFLIDKVFAGLLFPLVIAGLAPSDRLRQHCRRREVQLIDSPSDETMARLMHEAHIHLLYSRQADGIKIKLLNALHQGRFVIANPAAVAHSGLAPLCQVADSAAAFRDHITALQERPFPASEIERRRHILAENYADLKNAEKIVQRLS